MTYRRNNLNEMLKRVVERVSENIVTQHTRSLEIGKKRRYTITPHDRRRASILIELDDETEEEEEEI